VAQKPIPSYQVYKGDLFQLVDQAVDFVLSRIDVYVGDRSRSVDVDIQYEIPRFAVTEAIVNAIAHRDYTSTGSVQVMVFRNRIEIWNPGRLPLQLTLADLKGTHESFPANPLIAESLFYAGYIERLGTGIPDMIQHCLDAGLTEPEFAQEAAFRTVLWRKVKAADQVTEQVTGQVKRLILVLHKQMTRQELMNKLQMKHGQTFRENYIHPAIEGKLIEMTIPDKPNDPDQKYRLTEKGKGLQKQLKRK
jgi:predicted HTH transcriptional regulator